MGKKGIKPPNELGIKLPQSLYSCLSGACPCAWAGSSAKPLAQGMEAAGAGWTPLQGFQGDWREIPALGLIRPKVGLLQKGRGCGAGTYKRPGHQL